MLRQRGVWGDRGGLRRRRLRGDGRRAGRGESDEGGGDATMSAACAGHLPARGGRLHHQRGVPLFISRSR